MIDRLTDLKPQSNVPKPSGVTQELRVAQAAAENLRRFLWLSRLIHGTPKARPSRKDGAA